MNPEVQNLDPEHSNPDPNKQGFTHPVEDVFLEDVLPRIGYRTLTHTHTHTPTHTHAHTHSRTHTHSHTHTLTHTPGRVSPGRPSAHRVPNQLFFHQCKTNKYFDTGFTQKDSKFSQTDPEFTPNEKTTS